MQNKPVPQPLPTVEQFQRAHQSLWMRPADLAEYEHRKAAAK